MILGNAVSLSFAAEGLSAYKAIDKPGSLRAAEQIISFGYRKIKHSFQFLTVTTLHETSTKLKTNVTSGRQQSVHNRADLPTKQSGLSLRQV
jgi:hypothetical protein